MSYKVYLKGVYEKKGYQPLRYTDERGKRRVKKYTSKKKARMRLGLEMSRGWMGRIVKSKSPLKETEPKTPR